MKNIEIIPAIDIINGECVRLTQGDYAQKVSYFKDPSVVAKSYEDLGVKRLHVVDLDGAKGAFPVNLAVLEKIASTTTLDIQWGGGVKSEQALRAVFEAGANRAICGSIAVGEPEMFKSWITLFGAEHIILGADVRGGRVATHGWLEESQMGVEQLITAFQQAGLSQVVCTDISKDGMLQGPSFELYERLQAQFPDIDITVSGGISQMNDIERLNDAGLRSVIVGKAIYEGHITLKMIEQWVQKG